ncbi:helix-turn-helix domain-containing protein [Parapedobacter lycopersici]|uniref:helix-turn-helix domain-containing protein n=1 Tax=Parapedobacter lycopersici TaxID=1864939 RepID=UPI00214DE9B1|nr:helix-turn-helix domain-containing protein [Parapedobacter lycopersici]
MNLQRYAIIPELQPFIKLICTMDCDDDADTRHIRVLPDTCVELFVNYTSTPVAIIGDELHRRSIVTFRMSKPMDVQMRKGSGCLAICFFPGMAYRFMSLPMHLLTDTTTAAEEIWKGLAVELEDKLAHAADNRARVMIVQQYLSGLLAKSRQDPQVACCLQRVQLSDGRLTVGKLTGITGMSQRQLSRKFQQAVGLSPNAYLRVNRFIRSLQHLKRYPLHSLTEIAYESGYYDQAHFIRDYKDYAGYTPGELAQARHILY